VASSEAVAAGRVRLAAALAAGDTARAQHIMEELASAAASAAPLSPSAAAPVAAPRAECVAAPVPVASAAGIGAGGDAESSSGGDWGDFLSA
jgi:hypothetical protein